MTKEIQNQKTNPTHNEIVQAFNTTMRCARIIGGINARMYKAVDSYLNCNLISGPGPRIIGERTQWYPCIAFVALDGQERLNIQVEWPTDKSGKLRKKRNHHVMNISTFDRHQRLPNLGEGVKDKKTLLKNASPAEVADYFVGLLK